MLLAMFKKLLFTSLLALLPILIFTPLVANGQGTYPVEGVVFDDRNNNGVQDGGEPGIKGKIIYADNYNGPQMQTDDYGRFRFNVPDGTHSIEIRNAGESGGIPTTAEKIPVNQAAGGLRFGVQENGYDLVGVVRDSRGNPVQGVEVYLDNGYYRAVTDYRGVYRIENVTYDASQVIPGVQGGHNAYVRGYEDYARTPTPINPQQPLTRADSFDTWGRYDFNLPTAVGTLPPSGGVCSPGTVVSSGGTTCRNQEFCEIRNVCNSDGRTTSQQLSCSLVVNQCGYQGGGFPSQPSCQIGAPTGQPAFQGCSGNGQSCTMTPTYGTNCQPYNVATNCQPYTYGVCGYTGSTQQPVVPANNSFGTYSDGISQLMGQPSVNQGFQDPFFNNYWSQQPQQTQQLFSAPAQSGFVDDPFTGAAGFNGWDSGFTSQIMQDSFSNVMQDSWSQMDTSFQQSFPGFDWSY